MRTPDGYHSCDRCGVTGLRSVFRSGGGSDLCGDCHAFTDAPKIVPDGKFDGPMVFDRAVPGESRPVVTRMEAFPVAPPQSEFLDVNGFDFIRVSDVRAVCRGDASIGLVIDDGLSPRRVSAPYFAAWLDRLGIPWTDDLRKAHEAGKGEA